jgi:pimeloyl-ACP methyl ester carboxylesterase
MPRGVRLGVLGIGAVVVGLAVALGIDIARKGGLDAWLAPGLVETPGPTYQAQGRTVTVDGRAVYLDCRGTGSPTVILETGFGGGADGWGTLFDALAGITRTCAWDRPGIGRSDARGLHSAGQAVEDLRAALAAAGERGPYVGVAHSLGGVYARLFAAETGEVLELVMLDTYEPDLGMDEDPTLDADFRQLIRDSLAQGAESFRQGEELDWPATLAELAARTAPGTGPPTLLLYSDPYSRYLDEDRAQQEIKVAAWWRAIRARYPEGEIEIVPNSGHFIQFDQPALVIERVRDIVVRLRESG